MSLFKRREYMKVKSVAGMPVHTNGGTVRLQLGIKDGEPVCVDVPRDQAETMRDYLSRAIEALDHWKNMERKARENQTRLPPRDLAIVNGGQRLRFEDPRWQTP